MGHWEWGIGNGALGMGHWALGMGHGALIAIDFLQILWYSRGLLGHNLSISQCFFKNKC